MTNYSFTVTLKPRMYRYEPEKQYDETYRHLVIMLKSLSNHVTIVAECTKAMNLHYHGIIELHTKKQWYSKFRNSDVFGFTTCREQYNDDGWITYISKELDETYKCLDRRPVVLDQYSVFTSKQIAEYGTEW